MGGYPQVHSKLIVQIFLRDIKDPEHSTWLRLWKVIRNGSAIRLMCISVNGKATLSVHLVKRTGIAVVKNARIEDTKDVQTTGHTRKVWILCHVVTVKKEQSTGLQLHTGFATMIIQIARL